MRKSELFKSQERLDEKRSPPPILPKPKVKPKAKLRPTNDDGASPSSTNKNGALKSPTNRCEALTGPQPINSQAMQEIANEISKIKPHRKKKGAKSSSSDSDENVTAKKETKAQPRIAKKPIQHAKSLDFNELQTQEAGGSQSPQKHIQKSQTTEENSLRDKRMNGFLHQNAIYFESPVDGYSKMNDEPTNAEETSSTPREILQNLKERGANLMLNKKRIIQNICWPLGCQNGDNIHEEDEDPLYSSVNFATLGYSNGTKQDTYKEPLEEVTPEGTAEAFPNPIYSTSNPVSSGLPPKTDRSNVVQISAELGIKEVQSIVQGGSSYTVGDNMDLYALPVKDRKSSDTEIAPVGEKSTSIPKKTTSLPYESNEDVNTREEITPTELAEDDTYAKPMPRFPRKTRKSSSDSDKHDMIAGESEGPYAQTDLFQQSPTKTESQYDIPGILIDTATEPFDISPPNFKPPPPPPGGSPLLRRKNKNKHSPPVLRNKNKVKSPKKTILKTEPSPKDENFDFKMKRSQSEPDLTSETIFASPSSLGITTEDGNNNRHSMFVTPQEFGKLREYFVYSDENENESKLLSGKHRSNVGKGQKIGKGRDKIGNHENSFLVVPPPPTSTPIIDTDSMVAPPPPLITGNTQSGLVPPHPAYPPPRLHPSERALINVTSHGDELQWKEMVESLPPPPPELLDS